MKKAITLITALLLGCTAVLADGNPREAYGYRFADNWFVQAGGGVNTVFNASSFGRLFPAAEVRFGKWFSPSVGVRLGGHGIQDGPNGTQTGWFSGEDPFGFYHADVDVMWNVLNTFRYDERRFWDLVPFVRGSFAASVTEDGTGWEPMGGFGLHNGIRLGRRVDLYVEASAVLGRERAWRERGDVLAFPSLTAGVVVRLGRTGFRKASAGETVYVDRIVEKTDTVTIREVRVEKETVVDSVFIQKLRETPLILYFEIDVTTLTQRELDHLEYYANLVLTPDSKVLLTGSADKETGNPEHNQWLSEHRNAYVKDILVRVYHLKPENIDEIANGDRKNEFNTPEKNRCVTIQFVK